MGVFEVVEAILVLGVIIYFIGFEITKSRSGSSTDGGDMRDLKSIGEFFKKKFGTPDPGSNSISETGMTSTDYQSSGSRPEPVEDLSSFIVDTTKQQAAKARKSRKKSKPAQQNNQADRIDPTHGASAYDSLESLDGQEALTRAALPEKVNYDLNRPEVSSARSFYNPRSSLPRHKFKLDRERLINGFIMSELLQRRDFTKIFERIPSVRKD